MLNVKPYTHKLPTTVAHAMQRFATSACVLVKKNLATPHNRPLNCHLNVAAQIDANGGRCVNGWLLDRNSTFLNSGIWHWSFHSIWENADANWFDLTIDRSNQREYSTFIPDTQRKIDLVNGLAYNDILIFESKRALDVYGLNDDEVQVGEVYWVARQMALLKHYSKHTGQYRYLREQFGANFTQLEADYGVRVTDGALESINGDNTVHEDIFFDYAVS